MQEQVHADEVVEDAEQGGVSPKVTAHDVKEMSNSGEAHFAANQVFMYIALLYFAITVLYIVGGSTSMWVTVRFEPPTVENFERSFTRGPWRQCNFGDDTCYRTGTKGPPWLNTIQAFVIMGIVSSAITTAVFTSVAFGNMHKTMCHAAGGFSMFTAACGIIAMSIFVAKTPKGQNTTFETSMVLWTVSWCMSLVLTPIPFVVRKK